MKLVLVYENVVHYLEQSFFQRRVYSLLEKDNIHRILDLFSIDCK